MRQVRTHEEKRQTVISFFNNPESTMLFILGMGGTGKTYTVNQSIQALEAEYGANNIVVTHINEGDSTKRIIVNKVTGSAKIILESLRYNRYRAWLANEFGSDVVEFIGQY
jgi:Cdc6-like AAA superfamily ATPase